MVPGPNLRSSIVFRSCHPCSAPAAYLKLAIGLEDFLARFHGNAATAPSPSDGASCACSPRTPQSAPTASSSATPYPALVAGNRSRRPGHLLRPYAVSG